MEGVLCYQAGQRLPAEVETLHHRSIRDQRALLHTLSRHDMRHVGAPWHSRAMARGAFELSRVFELSLAFKSIKQILIFEVKINVFGQPLVIDAGFSALAVIDAIGPLHMMA